MAGKINEKIILIVFSFFFLSCAGQRFITGNGTGGGVYHRVKKGETLYKIARAYRVDYLDLAEANNIDNPDLIETGSVLFVPSARQVVEDVLAVTGEDEKREDVIKKPSQGAAGSMPKKAVPAESLTKPGSRSDVSAGRDLPPQKERSVPTAGVPVKSAPPAAVRPVGPPRKERAAESARAQKKDEIPPETAESAREKTRFLWPLRGEVVSSFGAQTNGMFFNGIDIAAGGGQSVAAAAGGTVIFSSPLKDYGETIIIKHADGFATVYTNLGERLVKRDEKVAQGAKIAVTGKAQGTLHFEIRRNNKAKNPLSLLP